MYSSTDEEDDDHSYRHNNDSDSEEDEHGQSGPQRPTREQQQQEQQQDSFSSSMNTNASSEDDDGSDAPDWSLNRLSSHEEFQEVEGIALLRQIFPDETTEELRQLHQMHIQQGTTSTTTTNLQQGTSAFTTATSASNNQQQQPFNSNSNSNFVYDYAQQLQPKSPLGRRVWNQSLKQKQEQTAPRQPSSSPSPSPSPPVQNELPPDFLRLPTSVAVRRYNEVEECWRYELVDGLQERALEQHYNYHTFGITSNDNSNNNNNNSNSNNDPISTIQPSRKEDSYSFFYTATIVRDDHVGLGMKLYQDEDHHQIQVHSLTTTTAQDDRTQQLMGPSHQAGIQPGDVLIGINGQAFRHQSMIAPKTKSPLLQHAVHIIQLSPDPIVLHLQRPPPTRRRPPTLNSNANDEHSMPPEIKRITMRTTPNRRIQKPALATPSFVPSVERSTSLLDATTDSPDDNEIEPSSPNTARILSPPTEQPYIHPFAKALSGRGLLHSQNDELVITRTLAHFMERTRQWESMSSFRIDNMGRLQPHFDPKDLPPDMAAMCLPFDYKETTSLNSYAPSTPTLSHDSPLIPPTYLDAFYGGSHPHHPQQQQQSQNHNSDDQLLPQANPSPARDLVPRFLYPGQQQSKTNPPRHDPSQDIFIPLMGVRKALSARILNTFVEDTRIAYTIWVYDAESGREWYAPVRFFQDFQDLRNSTVALHPTIQAFPFPKTSQGWAVFNFKSECDETAQVRQEKCRQLEQFLRALVAMAYSHQLHPCMAEIAIHVQSFLGCESLQEEQPISRHVVEYPGHTFHEFQVRLLLKRSIQRYTYRLFLMGTMRAIVDQFVNTARSKGPKLQDIESLEAQGRAALKTRAMEDMEQIQAFLDQLQDLILRGCQEDFDSIAQRRDFYAIQLFLGNEAYWDRLVREAVREQIEIEVYVPLRSVVSRLLVNGWRHEDMEVHFKMQELRKRPQGRFRIPLDKTSPSHWQSVANILKQGVGMSTLPCAKLRAIVDAAREISKLYNEEQNQSGKERHERIPPDEDGKASDDKKEEEVGQEHLGADDFLPIFIFCVVRAEMERPCALCVLLRTLCDRINRIGEIGYFLASFEAAIMHIQEIDLTEDQEDMLSFLSVPLTEVSLNE